MFCYIILHYQNFDITKRCVEALLSTTAKESKLIIVDNCSPNGSGELLKKYYEKEERISVIINSKNMGFAKGNNVGYIFAKKEFVPEIMVVMNNDVIIEDKQFESIIKNYMKKNNVDVAGPDIITLNNSHQNPLLEKPMSSKYINHRVKLDKIKYMFLRYDLFFSLYRLYKRKYPVPIKEKKAGLMNCMLHGACIIYGSKYIMSEEFAFLPITYMYNEEAILYDYLEYKKYKTGYCDTVSVLHMEGISTKERLNNDKEKILFRFKHTTESLLKQLKEREKYSSR